MAICLNNLKSEIKTLEKLFSKSHELFQIVNASVDELTCRFISKNGKKYDIHANITVSPCLIFSLRFLENKNGSSSCCWCGKRCERSAFRGKWCGGARCGKPRAGGAGPTKSSIDSGSLRKSGESKDVKKIIWHITFYYCSTMYAPGRRNCNLGVCACVC